MNNELNMGYDFPYAFSDEENAKYTKLLSEGNEDARQKLINHNLRLVGYIVKKNFLGNISADGNIEYQDLINIGVFGLIKAVNTFDISKNIKFATYATTCITNEILMDYRKRTKNKKNNISVVSLSTKVYNDENEFEIEDTLSSNEDITEKSEQEIINKMIRQTVENLNPKEREMIKLRFGFDCEPISQRELAAQYDLSQSYISRLEKKVLAKVAKELCQKGIIELPTKPFVKVKNDYTYLNMTEKSLAIADLIINEGYSLANVSQILDLSLSSIRSNYFKRIKSQDLEKYYRMMEILSERGEHGFKPNLKFYNSIECKINLNTNKVFEYISCLENTDEQLVLLLRLGYFKNKVFSIDDIALTLDKPTSYIHVVYYNAIVNVELIYNALNAQKTEKRMVLNK